MWVRGPIRKRKRGLKAPNRTQKAPQKRKRGPKAPKRAQRAPQKRKRGPKAPNRARTAPQPSAGARRRAAVGRPNLLVNKIMHAVHPINKLFIV